MNNATEIKNLLTLLGASKVRATIRREVCDDFEMSAVLLDADGGQVKRLEPPAAWLDPETGDFVREDTPESQLFDLLIEESRSAANTLREHAIAESVEIEIE